MSWQQSTLGEECELYQPQTLAKNELDKSGVYKVYGANGVIGTHSKFNHEDPQLLVTCRGATCGTINISEAKSWINGNAMVVKPRSSNIDLYFLSHYLHHLDISKAITGAAQPQITRQSLAPIKIQFPPLPQQQRIAAILDKAAEIKSKREHAIAMLDELVRSTFMEMFGDPITNPKNFQKQKLTEFFKFKTGKLDSNAAVENGKYPFFTCSREDFLIDEFAFDEEALLLAGNNASGDYSVKHYSGRFNAYQRTYVINLANAESTYEYGKSGLELMLAKMKRLSKGTSTKYLTMGLFNEMTILVPPKSLQEKYGQAIKQIKSVKQREAIELATISHLINSLQHQAFTTGFTA